MPSRSASDKVHLSYVQEKWGTEECRTSDLVLQNHAQARRAWQMRLVLRVPDREAVLLNPVKHVSCHVGAS